jgi:hypothetical protein
MMMSEKEIHNKEFILFEIGIWLLLFKSILINF